MKLDIEDVLNEALKRVTEGHKYGEPTIAKILYEAQDVINCSEELHSGEKHFLFGNLIEIQKLVPSKED